jgi:UDP-N-acetylmuramoyl-tripeptide--D-alanyl-D-alanine ligase
LNHLDENGVFIINGEDANCEKFPIERFKGKVVRYGFSDKFDVWASKIEYRDFKSYFTVVSKQGKTDCVIKHSRKIQRRKRARGFCGRT